MPDFRVTDELGQPLHAPCILNLTIPVSLKDINANDNAKLEKKKTRKTNKTKPKRTRK